ncbi:MAG: decaprenyl-phosphate phosphoribosyltransferase [Anaerolineae bacterium]
MLKGLLTTMRPKQWTKNVFVFAALVFDKKLFHPALLAKTVAAFALFCLLSSVVYLVNDLVDMEKDRQHPTKRLRPLASGQLQPMVAIVAAAAIILLSLPLSFWLDPQFGLIALAYLLTMIAYSFVLKDIVIVDVLTVAAGFVLRVAAGVVVVRAERFSPWLYICMTLLALFIGIARRRHELVLLEGNASEHRAILGEYNLRLLDEMITLVTAATMIAYSLYTFSAPNLPGNHAMMLTIPFVLYGMFRYLYLIHVRHEGGSPEELVFKDKPLFLAVALWAMTVVVIMYFL